MKWKKRADIKDTNTQILKIDNFRDVSREFLEIRNKTLSEEEKIKSKISKNVDSYYVNENKIDGELTDSMQCSPTSISQSSNPWNIRLRHKQFSYNVTIFEKGLPGSTCAVSVN